MSTESNYFEVQIESKNTELAAEEAARREEEEIRAAVQIALEQSYEKDARVKSNEVEDVYNPEEIQLCGDFLDFMRRRDFPGATDLEERESSPSRYVPKPPVKVYLSALWKGLRRGDFSDMDPFLPHGAELPPREDSQASVKPVSLRGYDVGIAQTHPAFLCEDGKIRILYQVGSGGIKLGALPRDHQSGEAIRPTTGFWYTDPIERVDIEGYQSTSRLVGGETRFVETTLQQHLDGIVHKLFIPFVDSPQQD